LLLGLVLLDSILDAILDTVLDTVLVAHLVSIKVPCCQYQEAAIQKAYLVPTVHGTRLPGIAFSMLNLARQPVQCPGIRMAGSSRFKSDTVSSTVLWSLRDK
jgi:hypothetical protein